MQREELKLQRDETARLAKQAELQTEIQSKVYQREIEAEQKAIRPNWELQLDMGKHIFHLTNKGGAAVIYEVSGGLRGYIMDFAQTEVAQGSTVDWSLAIGAGREEESDVSIWSTDTLGRDWRIDYYVSESGYRRMDEENLSEEYEPQKTGG